MISRLWFGMEYCFQWTFELILAGKSKPWSRSTSETGVVLWPPPHIQLSLLIWSSLGTWMDTWIKTSPLVVWGGEEGEEVTSWISLLPLKQGVVMFSVRRHTSERHLARVTIENGFLVAPHPPNQLSVLIQADDMHGNLQEFIRYLQVVLSLSSCSCVETQSIAESRLRFCWTDLLHNWPLIKGFHSAPSTQQLNIFLKRWFFRYKQTACTEAARPSNLRPSNSSLANKGRWAHGLLYSRQELGIPARI